jgi:hypothetical protein
MEATDRMGLVLTAKDRALLEMMEDTDLVIEARYISAGYKSWPELGELDRTCKSLHDRVGQLLRERGVRVRL